MSRVTKNRIHQVYKERLANIVQHVPLADIKREQAKALASSGDETSSGLDSTVSKQSLKNKRNKLNTTSIHDLATEPRPQVLVARAAAGGQPSKRSASYAIRISTINKGFEKDSY